MRFDRPIVASFRSLVVLTALLSACATGPRFYGPVELDVPFWKRPPAELGIVLRGAPEGGIYRGGGDEALHALITDARDRELIELVPTLKPDYEFLVDDFAAMLSERGLPVSQIEESDVVIAASAPPARYDMTEFPPYELKPEHAGRVDVQLLLVITPLGWGVSRTYEFGAVPMGPHYATFDVSVELYDLPAKTLLWSRTSSVSVAIPLHWNEPPEHPKVRAALNDALLKCGSDAVTHLKGWDGVRGELGIREKPQSGGASTTRPADR
ncbi:MAG: hypothetical protein WC538_12690 [Thermoanaerobaculia bacterium]|jgi:hypothetical protein